MRKLLVLLTMLASVTVAEAKDMSLTVNIYYTGENGNARKFAEEMILGGTVEAIRKEKGNIRYEYFYPIDDAETVLLIDSWEDQEAIDAHHATPMINLVFLCLPMRCSCFCRNLAKM